MSNRTNGLYEFGSFRLDGAKRLLTRAGESVTLAPKTFDLLLLLAESQGRVLTKTELMQALWPDTFVEEASLSYQISTLRKTLGEDGAELIETLPKHGYRFTVPVKQIDENKTRPESLDQGGDFVKPAPAGPQPRHFLSWLIAAAATLAAVGLAVAYFRRPPPAEVHATRFQIAAPEKASLARSVPGGSALISPDGRLLVLVAMDVTGKTQLWLRLIDSLSTQLLRGTDGALYPFWSPDSRFIGFFAEGKLKKIDASGGPPQTICNAADGRGGAWNRNGVVIFAPDVAAPLFQVSAAGGEPKPLTELNPSGQESAHRFPQFLPDGRHFLYCAGRRAMGEKTAIYLASLDSKDRTRLLDADSNALYAGNPAGAPSGPGYLLFLREQTLLAQPFDAVRLQISGEAVPVAEQVRTAIAAGMGGSGLGWFSVSDNGVLVYDSGGVANNQLLWFDRAGKQVGSVGQPGAYTFSNLSPDDKEIATVRTDPKTGTNDIWLFELSRSVSTRFTFDPRSNTFPVWSPDGSRIVFASGRSGPVDLVQKALSGVGNEEVLLKSGHPKFPSDWSRDGRFLTYTDIDPKTRQDLWVLPLKGERKPIPILRTEFVEGGGRFSPDGRWLAYVSNESGRLEVYVQPFSGDSSEAPSAPRGKRQVSTNGGAAQSWRRDGKELFYLATDQRLMAVEVKTGATFEATAPKPLFQTRARINNTSGYSVTADGQRFLIIASTEETASAPITVVVNWQAGLKR